MLDRNDDIVDIYTDGACSGNPGPGGWGALLIWGNAGKVDKMEISGGESETTNNRMELLAAIKALENLKNFAESITPSPNPNRALSPYLVKIRIYTDSTYVKNGITSWINGWKRNGWKTSTKKAVKNKDLWERLDSILDGHDIEWFWVKGHAGNSCNERADELARAGVEKAMIETKQEVYQINRAL
ncbi:MAG: Ribonuclease HI [Alphaproteobacteria bacterium MarineAlpha3_Bin5]|nr:ribonuclease HI [Magnetovibrio sp.]PPR76995.1 MAG: Ribonuclease HI [Alphaproteobacteria bacterium MarineAlpha3_Bin5]|tara:strand:- start:292 stop:849 length:558 start_codon:yes stop_codon:yes gene_type:complete